MPKSNATQKREGGGRQHLNHTDSKPDAKMSDPEVTDTMHPKNGRDAFFAKVHKHNALPDDSAEKHATALKLLRDDEYHEQLHIECDKISRGARKFDKLVKEKLKKSNEQSVEKMAKERMRLEKQAERLKKQKRIRGERGKGRREKKMGHRRPQVIEEKEEEEDSMVPPAQVMTMAMRPKAPIQQQPLPQPQVFQAGTFDMALRPK